MSLQAFFYFKLNAAAINKDIFCHRSELPKLKIYSNERLTAPFNGSFFEEK